MRLSTLPTQLLMQDWVNGKLINHSTNLEIAMRLSTLPTHFLTPDWVNGIHYNHSTNLEFAMRLSTLPTQLLMQNWVNGKLVKSLYPLNYYTRLSEWKSGLNICVGRILNLMSIRNLVECLKINFHLLNLASIIEFVEYTISWQFLSW